MSNTILVTYATRYGSTEEVAEAVAETLRKGGLEIDFRPMKTVQNLNGIVAVVMGAPLFIGKLHAEAHQFLARYQTSLTQCPTAVFALGPLGTDPGEMQGSRQQLDKELAQYPWLKPLAVEMFVGRYDPAKLSFTHRMLAVLPASPLHGLPASDHRDWVAIRAWTNTLPAKLGQPVRPYPAN